MVRAGEVDFAVLPGRTWSAVGAPAFGALQAPFVLTTFDATRRALRRPGRRGAQRRPRARRRRPALPGALPPPALPHPQAARRARGLPRPAHPALRRGHDRRERAGARSAARPGHLDRRGAQAPGAAGGSTGSRPRRGPCSPTTTGARRTTSPPTRCSRASRRSSRLPRAWKRLSPSQREVIQAAAQDTARADLRIMAGDAEAVESLCSTGVRLTDASAAQLRGLADATESVRVALRQAPATAAGHAGARGDARRGPTHACGPRLVRSAPGAGARATGRRGEAPGGHLRDQSHARGPRRGRPQLHRADGRVDVDDAAEGRQVDADRRSGAARHGRRRGRRRDLRGAAATR